jgi:predicted GNAT family N-acyltransferase
VRGGNSPLVKYLIDTNVFIPLEPTGPPDLQAISQRVILFAQKTNEAGFPVYVHPAQAADLAGDKNEQRRKMREMLFGKYPQLPHPPTASRVNRILGEPRPKSHDLVDHELLAAVCGDAIDTLVTEDVRLHRKARRLNVHHRVATVVDAIAEVEALCDKVPSPLPAVRCVKAHNIQDNDPIFVSVRTAYPDFDAWLTKCKREHRDCWVIPAPGNLYAGIAIVKKEDQSPLSDRLKTLKICTFKISEKFAGAKYGELLLRDVLQYAERNKFQQVYVEAYPQQEQLIDFFEQFGFVNAGIDNERGEHRLGKKLVFTESDYAKFEPLDFNRRFGPTAVKWKDTSAFIVPIKPKYHDTLFPEATSQQQLMEGEAACGNALRKAYLCNATSREIRAGAVLLFYRSEDLKAATVLGVAEDTSVSDDPTRVARFVGKRTVYPFSEIRRLCKKPVLAILFRQSQILEQPIPLDKLLQNKIIAAAPQSITKLSVSAKKWLQAHLLGQ